MLRIIHYIENNPVAAGLCRRPEDWPWASARLRSDWAVGDVYVPVGQAFQPDSVLTVGQAFQPDSVRPVGQAFQPDSVPSDRARTVGPLHLIHRAGSDGPTESGWKA